MAVAIVEDEVMIAYLIQDILTTGLGITDCSLFHTYEDAEKALETQSFAVVLLDLNLAGKMSTPLALSLKQRGIPTLIVSSYCGSIAAVEDLKDLPSLSKPFSDHEIMKAVNSLLSCQNP